VAAGRVNVPTSTPAPVRIQPAQVSFSFIQSSMFVVRRSLSRLIFWFTTKRLCMWCEPHHWMGGNPLARQHTGGMCAKAQREMAQQVEVLKAGNAEHRTSNAEYQEGSK
jgi:hypothetical protein